MVTEEGSTFRCVLLGRQDAPVAAAIAAASVELVAWVERWSELLAAVVDLQADHVVLDLASSG